MMSSVWPSLVAPAVLTPVCVDSKHSCRSQRPCSGQIQRSETQWGRERTVSMNAREGAQRRKGFGKAQFSIEGKEMRKNSFVQHSVLSSVWAIAKGKTNR